MLAQRFAFAQLLQRVPDAQDLANDERPALNRSRVPAQTCSGTPTRRVNVKSSSDAVAYPVFATPDGLCKDRPRNVAQVGPCTTKYDRARPSTTERGRTRRGVRIRSEFADSPAPWPNGWQTVGQTLVQPLGQGRAAVVKMPDRRWQKPAKVAGFFCCIALGKVDRNRRRTLYRSSWVRRRSARWRVREAPHCLHGDRSIRPCLWPCSRHRVECAGGCCLTSESEERETWTAESLRAACHAGASFA